MNPTQAATATRAALAALPAGADVASAVTVALAPVTAFVREYLDALKPLPLLVEPPVPPAPVLAAGSKYRCGQRQLFQPIGAKEIQARLPDGGPYPHDIFGPTAEYVDVHTGWPWDRRGSDWIDASGVRYGPAPWFSIVTDLQAADQAPKRYSTDVTASVQHCAANEHWLAFLLTGNAARTLAAAGPDAPSLAVEYEGGGSEMISAWCFAGVSPSTEPDTFAEVHDVPVFLEFKRPFRLVSKATLAVTVTQHWSGNDTAIRGYLLDPPVNAEKARVGTGSGRIGGHDYRDGSTRDDFILAESINYNAEHNFDPAIWGGQADASRLPHLGAGKWIMGTDSRQNWSLVDSTFTGEGFAPLAPGVGAMRIRMSARPVQDGSIQNPTGDEAASAMLYLPEPLFGRLDRIFVRYHMRLGTPYGPTKADRKQVRHQVGGRPVWTSCSGKFGIGPDHSTNWGGVSGTSGGPYGWQMRGSWYDCDAEQGGPDEGGIAAGHHLWDFGQNNPPDHSYGNQLSAAERWGQRGGLGGLLYAGHWYCIETELKLNTISNTAPGFLPDGELRTWIDGRLAYERTRMVFRSGPVANVPPIDNGIRPCRTLGIKGLWLNWFHGGKTLNTVDRTTFYSALAYGTEYIGPI